MFLHRPARNANEPAVFVIRTVKRRRIFIRHPANCLQSLLRVVIAVSARRMPVLERFSHAEQQPLSSVQRSCRDSRRRPLPEAGVPVRRFCPNLPGPSTPLPSDRNSSEIDGRQCGFFSRLLWRPWGLLRPAKRLKAGQSSGQLNFREQTKIGVGNSPQPCCRRASLVPSHTIEQSAEGLSRGPDFAGSLIGNQR